MKYEISKELLYEVLGINIDENDIYIKNNYIYYAYCRSDNEWINASSNIYEFAHKCKDWLKVDININHNKDNEYRKGWIEVTLNYDSTSIFANQSFRADTEPEAIFLACQWILDNKDKKNGI